MRLKRVAVLLALLAPTAPVVAASSGSVHGSRRPVVLVYAKAVAGSPSAPEWIWRARADGSHPIRLRRGHAPVVSPDGRTIAFARIRQVTSGGATSTLATLWLMRSDGFRARTVTHTRGGFGPIAWSPDSSRLLVGASDGLRLIVRPQGTARLLPGTEPSVGSAVEHASFAPDSRSIVFDRFDATGADVFTLSLAAGRPVRLTHDHKSFAPLWRPSKIAYQRGFIHGDIWLMGADGEQNVRLTRTAAGYYPAAWSEDGRRLLGANPANHNGRLWAVEVTTGRARRLTRWVGDLFPQGFSRDGRLVYAAIGCGGTASAFGLLETIPFSGGRPTIIVRGPRRGSWSA